MIGLLRTVGILGAVSVFGLVAPTARADTYVYEVHDLPLNYGHMFDFGAEFTGITEVSIRAVGIGGRVYYSCLDPTHDGWYDLHLTVRVGNSYIHFPVWYQVAYDVTAVADVEGSGEGLCDGDDMCFMNASYRPSGLSDIFCGPSEEEGLTISRVELTITANSVTPTESSTWGRVKAMYRSATGE
ncbi:MAG: hypothetical protein Q7W56_11990 [Candidatus Latescibacteria bacterium]|nr:hypothetical protein [Candidatus Latescibacterota bacterium]